MRQCSGHRCLLVWETGELPRLSSQRRRGCCSRHVRSHRPGGSWCAEKGWMYPYALGSCTPGCQFPSLVCREEVSVVGAPRGARQDPRSPQPPAPGGARPGCPTRSDLKVGSRQADLLFLAAARLELTSGRMPARKCYTVKFIRLWCLYSVFFLVASNDYIKLRRF